MVIYKAVADHGKYGLSCDNELYVGLKLVPYHVEGHDPLHEQIISTGTDGIIYFDGSIQEGKLYEIYTTNYSRSRETGQIDDWEIGIREHKTNVL